MRQMVVGSFLAVACAGCVAPLTIRTVGRPLEDPARSIAVKNVVDFNYQGRHQELTHQIAPEDVQWRDAFRAAGYDATTAERFIVRIGEKIVEGQALAP
jgi:hypothetical protein